MNETPTWALSLSYWLHMLATVTSVGGLATLVLIVLPITKRSLEKEIYAKLLRTITTRLIPIGWISIAVLIVTGLIQMSANDNYQGFLAIENQWAVSLLLKHMVFGVLLLVVFYQAWSLNPAIERVVIQRQHGKGDQEEADRLQKRSEQLITLNLILGVVILLLTAIARIS